MKCLLLALAVLFTSSNTASAFTATSTTHNRPTFGVVGSRRDSRLYMSSTEKTTTTKKGVQVMDRVETKPDGSKKKEEMWRVLLHNDEVHTFNYVIRSLSKVIGTLDRKAAFEICVQTHGIGKATVTKTWKKQAEQYCLGLQRQGLTVSISPDEDFEGGHSGGGL
jgi:ATP-dependent Clp protease adapter protein ClpS